MNRKHTLESARADFQRRDYTLKATVYVNNMTKMPAFCESCQNTFEISLGKLLCGRGCRWCAIRNRANKQRLSIDKIKAFFQENECTLLSTTVSSCHPLKYQCSCGNVATALLGNFRKGKRCGCNKKRGSEHYNWNPDRERVRLNELLLKKSSKALYRLLRSFNKIKDNSMEILLGYTTEELHGHITEHPNWEKVKDGPWQLDHIFPVSAFLDYGIDDIQLISSLDNIQPLSKADNLAKRARYDSKKFEQWLVQKGAL